jgi:hypothetical protein
MVLRGSAVSAAGVVTPGVADGCDVGNDELLSSSVTLSNVALTSMMTVVTSCVTFSCSGDVTDSDSVTLATAACDVVASDVEAVADVTAVVAADVAAVVVEV